VQADPRRERTRRKHEARPDVDSEPRRQLRRLARALGRPARRDRRRDRPRLRSRLVVGELPVAPFIVYLLGYPGVGKYTVARALAAQTGAVVIDNQLINNPILALFDGALDLPE